MEEEMFNSYRVLLIIGRFSLVVVLLAVVFGCSQKPAETTTPSVKKIPAGSEYSGFLKDYSNLKPNPNPDGISMVYVRDEAQKNLRSYFAIVVDPVEVYIATDADASKVSEDSRKALTNYFQHALIQAVSDAFPPVDHAGPLTLRLRTAIVGVDVGGQVAAGDTPSDAKPFQHALNIGKVGVEMELVDSVTGERIAAGVDRANLGDGAEVGAEHFSKVEKFAAARIAFDDWAGRVRAFLDSAHEITGADADRVDKAYQPYGNDK